MAAVPVSVIAAPCWLPADSVPCPTLIVVDSGSPALGVADTESDSPIAAPSLPAYGPPTASPGAAVSCTVTPAVAVPVVCPSTVSVVAIDRVSAP